ncbi:MAG: hypothetical protein Alis3KO_26280 [Aliiglaciecola sp.]
MEQQIKIIKLYDVMSLSNLSKTCIYRRVQNQLMPPPFSLGGRAVGYFEHEITGVLSAMAAGFSDKEIKSLVVSLIEKRKEAANAFVSSVAA